MPWLYDGLVDRPEWLRQRAFRPSRRQIRRLTGIARANDAPTRQTAARFLRRAAVRRRARRAAYFVLTDPVVTFALGLAGGPLIALELDRLTSPSKEGSWPLLLLGLALVALGAWLSRTKAVVDARSRGAWDTEDLDRRFRLLGERIGEVGDELGTQVHDLAHDVDAVWRSLSQGPHTP